jgi:hypothetical protein
MTKDKKEQTQEKSTTTQPATKPGELDQDRLDKVSGGIIRRTGDEDLEDLEVER